MRKYFKELSHSSGADDGSLYIIGGLGAIVASIVTFYYILLSLTV